MKDYVRRQVKVGRFELEAIKCRVGGSQRPAIEVGRSKSVKRSIVAFLDAGPWTYELRATIPERRGYSDD